MTTPRIAEIEQQAAKLRDQAARLNRTQADRDERTYSEYGSRVDDVDLASASSRGAAEQAHARAVELRGRAQNADMIAKDLEDKAAAMVANNEPYANEVADDFREQAQLLRAGAASDTRRAERAEQAARKELDRVEEYEREAKQIVQEGRDRNAANDNMRLTANELESKAFELEAAARSLRQAERPLIDDAEKSVHVKQAEEALQRADDMQPDFGRVETEAIVEAGIPISDIPGAELMEPTAMTSTLPTEDTFAALTYEEPPSDFAEPVYDEPTSTFESDDSSFEFLS